MNRSVWITVFVLLALLTVTVIPVHAEYSNEVNEDTVYEWLNGDTDEEYAHPSVETYSTPSQDVHRYFSGGFHYEAAVRRLSNYPEDEREDIAQFIDERLEEGEYPKFDDQSFLERPEGVSSWNSSNIQEWSSYRHVGDGTLVPKHRVDSSEDMDGLGSDIRSVGGTSIPGSDPLVEDAHLTIYDIENSAYVHRYREEGDHNDVSDFYIGSNGVMTAIFGAQSGSAPSSVNTGTSLGSTEYRYNLGSPSLENVQIWIMSDSCHDNGCLIGSATESNGVIEGEYSISEYMYTPGETYEIRMTGEVTTELREREYDRIDTGRTRCVDWSEPDEETGERVCLEEEAILRWSYEDTETYEYSMEISHTKEVMFPTGFEDDSDDSDVTIEKAIFADGSVEGHMDFDIESGEDHPNEPWSRIEVNGDSINSGMHYLSSREKRWDTMVDESTGDEYASAVRPLTAHSYRGSFDATSDSSDLNVLDTDVEFFTGEELYQPRLQYHESCWKDPEEDEENPEDAEPCYWTQTAAGVIWVESGDDGSSWSWVPGVGDDDDDTPDLDGSLQKNPYTAHSEVESVAFSSRYDFDEVTTHSVVDTINRTDEVDYTREVDEIEMTANRISPEVIDQCQRFAAQCPRNPDPTEIVLSVTLQDGNGNYINSSGEEGIERVVVEDAQFEDGRIVDAEAEEVGYTHYLYLDSREASTQETIRVETEDWFELDRGVQAYEESSTRIGTGAGGSHQSLLRTGLYLGLIIMFIVIGLKKFLQAMGRPEHDLEYQLADLLVSNQIIKLLLLLGFLLLLLEAIFGGIIAW